MAQRVPIDIVGCMSLDGVLPLIPDQNRNPLASESSVEHNKGPWVLGDAALSPSNCLQIFQHRRWTHRYVLILFLHPFHTSQMPICIVWLHRNVAMTMRLVL
jgi:hypothetical protein